MPIRSDPVRFESVSKVYRLRETSTLKEYASRLLLRRNLTQSFYALRDVSFTVEKGETLGIIGRNGGGKSTVLKLIAGVTRPTAGTVSTAGRIAPLLELGTGFHPDLTGRENVYLNGCILGLTNRRISQLFDRIVEFSELEEFIDTPVKRYSSGMYMRLAFSVAIHCEPDVLVVDEGLAVGDAAFQEKCLRSFEETQNRGTTIVMVSHDLSLIESYCTRVILLDHGRRAAEGDPRQVVRLYRQTLEGVDGVVV